MAQHLTAKQEAFARDLATGVAITQAYRNHYSVPTSANALYVNASKLAQNTKIVLRVSELQAAYETATRYTLQEAMSKALAIYEACLGKERYSQALQALDMANKLSGYYVTKVDVSGEVTHTDQRFQSITTDELMAFVDAKRKSLEAPATEAEYRELESDTEPEHLDTTESVDDTGNQGLSTDVDT